MVMEPPQSVCLDRIIHIIARLPAKISSLSDSLSTPWLNVLFIVSRYKPKVEETRPYGFNSRKTRMKMDTPTVETGSTY